MKAPDVRTPAGGPANAEARTGDGEIIARVVEDANKALESLKTRARNAGFTLHELADGSMLLSRWGLARPLPDLFAVRRFLDQVTGVRQ